MGKMKLLFLGCTMGIGLIATSCSSDDEVASNGSKGSVRLSVQADATFSTTATRAVDEESYKNTANYTVQILGSDNQVVEEYATSSEIPDNIELANGSYTLKAFYGTDSEASRNAFYVEGTSAFSVQGNEQTVAVSCAPTCGKVAVNFGSEMDTYFSDYYVVYETAALTAADNTAIWAKGDTEPWYLKVAQGGESIKATIHITRVSDGKATTVERTHTLAPNKAWTLSIAPKNENGNLGIEITVDETTNDINKDIIVPSEWI